jgi:hypothetical protein
MPRATTSRLFSTPELTLAPFPTAPPYDAAGDREPVYHPGQKTGAHTRAATRLQRDRVGHSHTQDHRRPAPMTAPTRSTSESDLIKVAYAHD